MSITPLLCHAAGADHRQADYFLGLLAESCREIDRRIEEYQKAITIAETSGAVDDAGGIRYLMRTEERERQTLQGLIGRLQERFVGRAPDEVPVRSRL